MRVGSLALAIAMFCSVSVLAQAPLEIRDRAAPDPAIQRILHGDISASLGVQDEEDNLYLPDHVTGPDAPISPEELRSIARMRMRMREGDGGGANIVQFSLQAIQTNFNTSNCPVDCDPETDGVQACNVVLLVWDEVAPVNSEGIAIFVDGKLLMNVDGIPADVLEKFGTVVNFVFIKKRNKF